MSGCGGEGSCSSGGCQQQQQQQQGVASQPGSFGSWARRHGVSPNDATSTPQAADAGASCPAPPHNATQLATCMKCKAAPAVTNIRQNEPYCHSCIEAGVLQKVRAATKYKGLLSTGDTALLGLSGGAASAGLLYCMCCMQAADSQRPGRGKLAFQLSVLHVDCSLPPEAHLEAGSGTAETNGQELQQGLQTHQDQLLSQLAVLAAAAGYVQQQPLLLHLSDVFCTDPQLQELLALQQPPMQRQQPDEQPQDAAATPEPPAQTHRSDSKQVKQQQQEEERLQRLQALASAVGDPTGREDLLLSLRDQLLQRAAAALSCSRLLRGDSASRVAVRVIAEAAKGRGFSLPSDIQYFDGRHAAQGGPCLLQPLREVTHKELRELCSYKSLPLVQLDGSSTAGAAAGSSSGSRGVNNVNALSERFVHEMEASLPASIYAIIRTAAHLEPFDFTEAATLLPQAAAAAKKHHRHQQHGSEAENGAQQGTLQQWRWCGVCQAPLPAAQLAEAGQGCLPGASNQLGSSSDNSSSYLCYSCNRQILQQVRTEPGMAKGTDPGQRAVVSLQDKMQRLRELLPPGMILESDSEGDGDEAH